MEKKLDDLCLTSNLDLSKTISTVALSLFSNNIKLVDLVMPLIVKSPVTSYLSMSIFSVEVIFNEDLGYSSTEKKSSELIGKKNNLDNLFDDLFSIEQVKIYKPDSKVYDLPVKKYKIKPVEIFFLSANTWDVSGGGNYGYNSVWVNRNKSHFDNLDYYPKNEIGNLTQLLDIV